MTGLEFRADPYKNHVAVSMNPGPVCGCTCKKSPIWRSRVLEYLLSNGTYQPDIGS